MRNGPHSHQSMVYYVLIIILLMLPIRQTFGFLPFNHDLIRRTNSVHRLASFSQDPISPPWLVKDNGSRSSVSLAAQSSSLLRGGGMLLPSIYGENPLVSAIPLAVWTSLLFYSWKKKDGGMQSFGTWMGVHDFHAYGVMALGACSLFFSGVGLGGFLFYESLTTFFTMSYFIVDLVDCILRKDWMFVVHALLALVICGGCYTSQFHYHSLKTVSLGSFVELSTPALHKWYFTKQKRDYWLYFLLFTACRIVWIPVIIWNMVKAQSFQSMLQSKIQLVLLAGGVGLYLLQLGWYGNMINILFNHDQRIIGEKKQNGEEEFQGQINLVFGGND